MRSSFLPKFEGFLPYPKINFQGTVDERPNIGYDSEKVKNVGPQTGFEPTALEEMGFQAESSTTEL
jgi:hypothetical protein